MPKPFLIKHSKRLRASKRGPALVYDPAQQLSVLRNDPNKQPAISRTDIPVLATKKSDIEKGEDQKDRWLPAKFS
jgi:hypothetical protein